MSADQMIRPFNELLCNVAKCLTSNVHFRALKYFAELSTQAIEECENQPNPINHLFSKLENKGTISENDIGWLHAVFSTMNIKPVMDLLNDYERRARLSPFRMALYQVAMKINVKTLDALKLLVHVNESELSDVKTALDLFAVLERHGFIGENRVDRLKRALETLECGKLAQILAEYEDTARKAAAQELPPQPREARYTLGGPDHSSTNTKEVSSLHLPETSTPQHRINTSLTNSHLIKETDPATKVHDQQVRVTSKRIPPAQTENHGNTVIPRLELLTSLTESLGNNDDTMKCFAKEQVQQDGAIIHPEQNTAESNCGERYSATEPKQLETQAAKAEYLKKVHTDSPGSSQTPHSGSYMVSKGAASRGKLREIAQQQYKYDSLIELNNYQTELAVPALDGRDCIICAPTGSGKSFIAAYVCYEKRNEALKQRKQFKALFTMSTDSCHDQLKENLIKIFANKESDQEIGSCVDETHSLSELLEHHSVVLVTGEILKRALICKELHLDKIQLLILDEYHHTNDTSHPYYVINQKLKEQTGPVPQVVGLMASLGVQDTDKTHINCSQITVVQDRKHELLQHNPPPKEDQLIIGCPRDCNDLVILILGYLMTETERIVASQKQNEEEHFMNKTLHLYEEALSYCHELTKADVLLLLEQHFSEPKWPSEQGKIMNAIWKLYDSQIQELRSSAQEETTDKNYNLQKLSELLKKLFHNNVRSKGVLVTRTSFGAKRIVRFLGTNALLEGLIRCAFSDSKEKHHLSEFKTGDINLLVTPEEHACIPLCSFLICYNFDPTRIWFDYPHTAKKSECYVIGSKDLLEKTRAYEKLKKEHDLMEELNKLIERNEHKQQRTISSLKESKRLPLHSASNISIHCKNCRQLLCCAADLKKQRDKIIVSSEEIQGKINTRNWPVTTTTGNDDQVAYIFCAEASCNRQLGSKSTYGYALINYAVSWKWLDSDDYQPVREWERVPFPIEDTSVDS